MVKIRSNKTWKITISTLSLVCILCLCACSTKNQNVTKVTESSKKVIEHIVKEKPECKEIANICSEQINTVNEICQIEISKERDHSWTKGFYSGIITLFLVLMGFVILTRNKR